MTYTEQAQLILHYTETIPGIIASLSETELSANPAPGKWSKKEILGHLIDSATNNHQRIIRAQYEHSAIVYDQDKWNSLNHYDTMPAKEIVNFWVAYNRHFAALISRLSPESLSKTCDTGGNIVTLESLITDYVRHLEHHLQQITGDGAHAAPASLLRQAAHIQYSRATEEDAILLAEYRIEFLTELTGPKTNEDIAMLRKHLENYFREAISNNAYIGLLAKDGDQVAGTGGMTMRVQPGSFKNPSGKMGYILNMYTIPAYRKIGICSTLIKMLIAIGEEMGVGGFELHATTDGAPVYRKQDFKIHNEPTYRRYEQPLTQ